jgi:Macrocin-O-methyltransferase (TylF)
MKDKTAPEASSAFGEALDFRRQLGEMFADSPLPKEDMMFNLGLYVRSSLLVKFLVLNDLYLRFKSVPGVLMEFGTWWGQNLVLLENLRAIHEPFNKQRTIIGFDTFSGYPKDSDISPDATQNYAGYKTIKDYAGYLAELLKIHEGNNAFGHNRGGHKLIQGDVEQTAPRYFSDHPETVVAFAYFDMGPYKPTISALRALKPNLVPGSVLLFDELTWAGAPGEAIAFKEVFANTNYRIEKCELYPSKAIVTIQ